jgi:signal transduction histidine kinase
MVFAILVPVFGFYAIENDTIKKEQDKVKNDLNSEDLGDKVQIEIYNDSRPIGEEDRGRLFKRFSRLSVPQDKKVKGAGLGLFIT